MSQVDLVGFSCAACGKQYRWKPELAGKTVRCKCGSPVNVPKQQGGSATPAASSVHAAAHAPGLAAAARSAEVPPRAPKLSAPSNVPPPPPPPPGAPRRAGTAAAAPISTVPAKPAPRKQETYDDPFGDNSGNADAGGDLDALAALAEQEAAVAEDAASSADLNFCANCRSRMSPDAVLCTNCGFDRRKGAVLAAAKVKDPSKRFFGLLKAKKVDPKKPVDKMAPQGSFMVGVAVSFALAIAAAIPWVAVAFGAEVDVYILVALIGVGAGVGMQLGQKGYSTAGGFTAAGITILVMFMARLTVVLMVLLPVMQRAAAAAAAADRKATAADVLGAVVAEGAAGGDEDERGIEAQAAKEDPRVIEVLQDRMYGEMGIDPKFAEFGQHEAAREHAMLRATTMPSEEKQKLIAIADQKHADEKLRDLLAREFMETQGGGAVAWQAAEGHGYTAAAKLTPAERKAELARLEAKFKTADEASQQEFAEATRKARQKAAAAANDGLDDEDDPAPDELAMADDEDEEDAAGGGDGLDDEEDGSAGGSGVAAAAASGGGGSAAAAEEEDDDGPGLISFGLTVIFILVFFGNFKSFFFIVGAILLAYRTAAGATWG